MKCYACDKIGHFAAKCRGKTKDESKERDSLTYKVFATFTTQERKKSEE